MNRQAVKRFMAPVWIVTMLFAAQIGGAEINKVVFQVHSESLPGNPHFQWFSQMQKEKAEISEDDESYAEHSTMAANAAIAAANGYGYDAEHTLTADYSEDKGITRFAVEGVVPMLFIDKDKASVPVEMLYKYCKSIFDGDDFYTYQKDLATDHIDIEFKITDINLDDAIHLAGLILGTNYVSDLNKLLCEYRVKIRDLTPIRSVEDAFVEYSLNQAYPIISSPFRMQIASDGKWIKLISESIEYPSSLTHWRFREAGNFFPSDLEILLEDTLHYNFTVKSFEKGDENALKVPDNVKRTSPARKRDEIPH
ncbi:MAG: hypothetical protein JXR73_23315 [Candidatus Omnitrophica bacterium]|nr:hypothetical protein [Candidatus Omnitrophota bacterium]